ncbi:hypothetical protein [endosymbiont of Lamellibrachia barhami]|uniref:hypothetical protein n=1 Tax=endosymbiont of Lamellibrachia barhami TaxID=205975 RepID=UPI0015AD6489|nr:hypothetical protein [endosymbiont of Lamellibrachia barhami]
MHNTYYVKLAVFKFIRWFVDKSHLICELSGLKSASCRGYWHSHTIKKAERYQPFRLHLIYRCAISRAAAEELPVLKVSPGPKPEKMTAAFDIEEKINRAITRRMRDFFVIIAIVISPFS